MLDEADSEPFKKWVIKRLEHISDADSDVLADYVLALVKTDEPEAQAKSNCIEQLRDFLGDHTIAFVEGTFRAIRDRSWDATKPTGPSSSVYEPPGTQSLKYDTPRLPNESRKRSYQRDGAVENVQNTWSSERGDRPVKQPRRGGRRGGDEPRGGFNSRAALNTRPYGAPGKQLLPPTPPPGMPAFDANDAIAAFIAMQQEMGMPILPLPSTSQARVDFTDYVRTGQRCRDYDTKGFCARGVSCPYEHGENPYVVPTSSQYDPNNATGMFPTPNRTGNVNTLSPRKRGRGGRQGRGKRASYRGGKERAHISHVGPIDDSNATTLVVEQIPEEYFEEQKVRDFFNEFGTIEDVEMRPYKHLAVVKYGSHESAQAAYDSPKSVFDNRFVKVYWYKPDVFPQSSTVNGHARHSDEKHHSYEDIDMTQATEPDLDPEEVAKRQEEAQRKHDESRKQLEEAHRRKLDLDEKLKVMDQERKKMAELLAKKAGKKAESPNDEDSTQTRALKEQLAKLEAEAKRLGIDPDAPSPTSNGFHSSPGFRGRGGYRGRGSLRARGHYSGYGGGWHRHPITGVRRLDNRPKTVSVTVLEGSYSTVEGAIRQHLTLSGPESAVLTKHPSREDTALVAFQQRFEGENFMAAATGFSDLARQLGQVELAWYTPTALPPAAATTNGSNGHATTDGTQTYSSDLPATQPEQPAIDTYDENEDMDHWG